MINFNLSGKVALVTRCNTGLGQGTAVGLAHAGANIIGVGYEPALETKAKIESLGRKFHYINTDLMSQNQLVNIVNESVDVMGRIDILINNAGITRRQDFLEFSSSNWDEVININQKTVFFLSQAVAKQFVKQGEGGKIINITSMLSFQGGIHVPSYSASKSAVMGLTRALADELAPYKVNVNAIAPGYMATDNTEALRADEERDKAILKRIPANRWGTPDDLSGPVVFLASSASDYVNGHTIAVDGGWLAR